ncbi:MAG TPA: hypothetical protein VHK90_16730 [Thermoanaerobaculia bacterium]|nr:hypothetical protein [Thermoanaerobaculia bacterium]
MKRTIIAIAVCLIASAAFAQRRETGGGQKVIGDGNNNTTYYAPAFAYGEPNCNLPDRNGVNISGSCVYLYVQGDHSLSDTTYTDQVLMYWNPNTWAGQTSKFAGGTRLLPGVDFRGIAMPAPEMYGHPSVFQYNGNYYMTALQSPDGAIFDKQWWGVSPDGKSWTWYPLFNYTGTRDDLKLPSVTLQPQTIGGVLYFFGFLEVWQNGGIGMGLIRLRANATKVRGYDRVDVYTSTGWVTIVSNPETNPDGNFNNAVPAVLWHGRTQPKYLATNEVWWSGSGPKDCTAMNCMNVFSGAYTGWGDRIGYANVVLPTTSTGVATLTGADNLHSDIRCMPGRYDGAREYPQPLAGGSPRLLYSASNDDDFGNGAYCNSQIWVYPGMYIVVTAF